MRLLLILPRVEPDEIDVPQVCPYEDCAGESLRHHQAVQKALRDTQYPAVEAERYQCLKCRRTFRIYPTGVNRGEISLRVKGLGVMLYLLGLSYGATSLALEALGVPMSKTQVYETVQSAAERVPGMKQDAVFEKIQTPALGGDVTSVRCNGEWLQLGLTVDDTNGLALSVDGLTDGENAEALKVWMEPIAESVGAEILVSDDADAFKRVADETGRDHQVCKGHVGRNTEALIGELTAAAQEDIDGSLSEIDLEPGEVVADLDRLGKLVEHRRPADEDELEKLHQRYQAAAPPGKGEAASVAYRIRQLMLDRWNLWRRLTRYRTWVGPNGETIDGTNNGCERAIGWWIKERYRTMRGYKRLKSAINISRLLAWCGNHLNRGGADLGLLLA